MESSADSVKIPIPSQIPQPPDLSFLPANILRSGAVDALVQQNEDLMSRLAVSLRRIAILEEKLTEQELVTQQMRFHYENFEDQILVLKEKNQTLLERQAAHEAEVHAVEEQGLLLADQHQYDLMQVEARHESQVADLKRDIHFLEARYSEFLTASTERQDDLEQKLSFAMRSLARHLRYRQRIRRALEANRERQAQAELKFALCIEDHRVQLERTQDESQNLAGLLAGKDAELNDLQKKLGEAATYIQQQAKMHDEKMHDMAQLKEKCHDYEKLLGTNISLNNKIVFIERQREQLQSEFDKQVDKLETNLSHYRTESKERALEVTRLRSEADELRQEKNTWASDRESLQAEIDNLQVLWREGQTQVTDLDNKHKALQKLNQQLSLTMNQYRKEIAELRTQLANRPPEAKAAPATESATQADDQFRPEYMNKIDSLINEIQSGFVDR